MHAYMNECIDALMHDWMHARQECMYDMTCMNEGMNEWMNEWMNAWMIELLNELMLAWKWMSDWNYLTTNDACKQFDVVFSRYSANLWGWAGLQIALEVKQQESTTLLDACLRRVGRSWFCGAKRNKFSLKQRWRISGSSKLCRGTSCE